jgi:hypothetical protein
MKRPLVLAILMVAQAGCGSGFLPEPDVTEPPLDTPVPPPPPSETPVNPPPTATGFPCDVHAVLQANCASCHAGRLYGGPNFDSRDDLFIEARDLIQVQTHPIEPGTFGALIAVALRDGTMPPYGAPVRPSMAERELVIGWVDAGMPAGDCGALIASP